MFGIIPIEKRRGRRKPSAATSTPKPVDKPALPDGQPTQVIVVQSDAAASDNKDEQSTQGAGPIAVQQSTSAAPLRRKGNKLPEPPIVPPTMTPNAVDGSVNSTSNTDSQTQTANSITPSTIMAIIFPLVAVTLLAIVALLILKRRNQNQSATKIGPARLNSALEKATKRITSLFKRQKRSQRHVNTPRKPRVPALGLSWLQPQLDRYTKRISSWFQNHPMVEPAILAAGAENVAMPNQAILNRSHGENIKLTELYGSYFDNDEE